MAWPNDLNVALKEWAIVCDALANGRQMILLRKGGISESIGGFEIEHRDFLFFPTYVHQKKEMLKEAEAGKILPAESEPAKLKIFLAGKITDIVVVPSRAVMDSLDDVHIWGKPLIDMRFNYRPKNPLYLLIVRAYRLNHAVEIENRTEYAGCKSWVPLEKSIATDGAAAAMGDAEFEDKRKG